MRVLIVSAFYPPQPAVASLRVHGCACAWADAGEDVTVLTTTKRPDQRGAPAESPGVRVVEVPYRASVFAEWLRREAGQRGMRTGAAGVTAGPRGRPGPLARWRARSGVYAGVRMPDLTDAWVTPAVEAGLALAEDEPFDVVMASSGPYTTLLVANRLKRLGAARRFVAEFRDLWTANHHARGVFPLTLRERALERAVLREADMLVTVSEPLAEWLGRRSTSPVEVIYNGHTGMPPPGLSSTRAADPGRLVYTGTLYPAGQDAAPFMHALARLRRDSPALADRIRLTVAGSSGTEWLRAARQAGVAAAVEDLGLIGHAAAIELQRTAGALLSIEWSGPQGGVLTAKVFEYLASVAPVFVIGPRGPISDLVERAGRGAWAGQDPAAIARSLALLVEGAFAPDREPDRALIESYSRQSQSLRLLGRVRTLV